MRIIRIPSQAKSPGGLAGKPVPMPDDAVCRVSVTPSARAAATDAVALTLADLPQQVSARVVGLRPPVDSKESRQLALRLLEIGFMAGEAVRVIAHGRPGRDPIAARIGGTTFALRRFEAEQVLVAVPATHAQRK